MKIFTAKQTQKADAYTIANEPIDSIGLMERASKKVFKWLKKTFKKGTHFDVVCGPGNNGGDGLAVARLLFHSGFSVAVWHLNFGTRSTDNEINNSRLKELGAVIYPINEGNYLEVKPTGVVVDAIFGSGLTRPVTGWVGEVIHLLNQSTAPKVSIDIASGLFAENNDDNVGTIFQPNHTLTFEMEKLAFQFPENQNYVGKLKVLPIGLHPEFISNEPTSHFITSKFIVKMMHHKPHAFSYKNNFGHALIVAGSKGKMGAAVLSAKACLKSGAGLVTAHVPKSGNQVLQIAVPEVMTNVDSQEDIISDVGDFSRYASVGIGPGLGLEIGALNVVRNILDESKNPLIMDADALNAISLKNWSGQIPKGSILTPHLGEWRRLAGEWKGGFDRLEHAKSYCKTHQVVLVLKGAKSAIVCPDGEVFFNSTGNSGMATAGSGDVLTGILTALLAQGYSSKEAAILGVYIHGLAGDMARKKESRESLLASNIIEQLGKAFRSIS